MAYFKSEREIERTYPYCMRLVNELKMSDYPKSKLVKASHWILPNDQIDIYLVYDIGSPESYLWIWASNLPNEKNNFLIDECFEIDKAKALMSIDNSN